MPREIHHFDEYGKPVSGPDGAPLVTIHHTVTEAAQALGIHRSTLLRMADRGDAHLELIGARWYVSAAELARLTAEAGA